MNYFWIVVLGLAPTVLSVLLFLAFNKIKALQKWPYALKQIITGILFGIIAILGTQFGTKIPSGAVLNARDAAPVAAGLIFGLPAGVIAGVLGGGYRALYGIWNPSARFTLLACSISTAFAGLIAGFVRKKIYRNKVPSWLAGTFTGLEIECFHMLMVFITNMNNAIKALEVIKAVAIPMLIANTCSAFLATFIINLFIHSDDFKAIKNKTKTSIPLSFAILRLLLILVFTAFSITGTFTYFIEKNSSDSRCAQMLQGNISDIEREISDKNNANIKMHLDEIVNKVSGDNKKEVYDYAFSYSEDNKSCLKTYLDSVITDLSSSVNEINLINSDGVIFASTNSENYEVNLSSSDNSLAHDVYTNLINNGEAISYKDENDEPRFYIQELSSSFNKNTMKYASSRLVINDDDTFVIQVGMNVETFTSFINDLLTDSCHYRRIGQTGRIIVVDHESNVVSDRLYSDGEYDDFNNPVISYQRQYFDAAISDKILSECPQNEVITLSLKVNDSEVSYYANVNVKESYYVISLISTSEIDSSKEMSFYVVTFIESLIYAALFVMIYFMIRHMVVSKINLVNRSLKLISEGDLDEKINIMSVDEFKELSKGINYTVDALKGYIAEASARIDKELEFAKSIQFSSLPSIFPPYPSRSDLEIYASMHTAKEVGGDFYDFYFIDDNHFAILIADVSGKGIPAAMFMMQSRTIIKSLALEKLPIDEILTEANRRLCLHNEAGMFVTCWMGIIDMKSGEVEFVNAGHNPPLLYRKDTDSYSYFKTPSGLVLAGFDSFKYRRQTLKLMPGDRIYLYTDGVTEATNSNNELFSEPRLLECINNNKHLDVESLCRKIKDDVDSFVGEAPQFDDITMLLFLYLGNGEEKEIKVTSEKASLNEVTDFIESNLEGRTSLKVLTSINVAVDEIFSNIVNYAYGDEVGMVKIKLSIYDSFVKITFKDKGISYNPLQKADPDVTLSLDEREIGGLGIYIVKKTMDAVSYERQDDKNILTIKKYFKDK